MSNEKGKAACPAWVDSNGIVRPPSMVMGLSDLVARPA